MTAAAARVPLTTPDTAARSGRTVSRGGSLQLVPPRRAAARRAPFAAVVVGLLAAGLLVLLVLNTVLAQDAFTLHALQVQGKALADQEQELSTSVQDLEAPAALAQRAAALGMVPGGPPAFLHLPDGTVSGLGTPAQAPALVGDRAVPPAPAAVTAEAQAQVEEQAQDDAGTGTAADPSAGTSAGPSAGTDDSSSGGAAPEPTAGSTR